MRRTSVCPEPGCPHLRPCPTHAGPTSGKPWGTHDRAAQAAFRKAVLMRDGYRCMEMGCEHYDPTGRTLRACHITPRAQGGSDDLSNGRTRCETCDRKTDPYAR